VAITNISLCSFVFHYQHLLLALRMIICTHVLSGENSVILVSGLGISVISIRFMQLLCWWEFNWYWCLILKKPHLKKNFYSRLVINLQLGRLLKLAIKNSFTSINRLLNSTKTIF